MNKVILIGNIATDIDLRYTPNGNAVAKFNLAVNERDTATFIPVETWKKQAENVSQYCGKGSKVAVEGSIKIDQWEKDGQKKSFTKVNAFNIQFLDTKKSQRTEKDAINDHNNDAKKDPFANNGEPVDISDDDLPF